MTTNRNILIVDDQEDLRQQVAKLLKQEQSSSETSSLIDQIRSRISSKGKVTQPSSNRVHYAVDTVGQGKDAYDRVKNSFSQNNPYALMFLDMRMPPGWDGLETAQRIRGIDKEIEIVIMTAYADYDQQEIAEKIGEPDKLLYIKKPFHPEEIRQLALALTEKWNMNRREKERLILTNRLMRENSALTRISHKRLSDTSQAILDAFVSFLDARAGLVARRYGDKLQPCAATSDSDEAALVKALPESLQSTDRTFVDEKEGFGFFPIVFEGFNGFVYIERKQIIYSYDQLRPFLDILTETAREVMRNSALLQEQAEERRLATVGSAVGRIAEEVEDTLTVVRNCAEKISETEDRAERDDLCAAINGATDHTLRLAHDVLQFSRGHKQALQFENEDIAAMLEGTIEALQPRIDAASITVSTEVDDEFIICCDARTLAEALGHVVTNAVETLEQQGEGGRLEVRGGFRSGTGKSVQITVHDSGPGVAAEISSTLFDPFVSHGEGAGNGLGLTVAKQIVEQHRGHISFHSTAESGTVFTVTVPTSPEQPPTTEVHLT
jgi:signal transduction histidine kinase